MGSKDWKSLAFVSAMALIVSACGSDKEEAPPSSPFVGIWASADTVTIYRTYGSDIRAFCDRYFEMKDGWYKGKRVTVRQNGHLIQANGEVFTYRASDSYNDKGFYEENFQGHVKSDGLFVRQKLDGQPVTGAGYGIRTVGPLADKARMYIEDVDVLKIYQGDRHLYFMRTTNAEMDAYLSARATCNENWAEQQKRRPGEPNVDVDEDGNDRGNRQRAEHLEGDDGPYGRGVDNDEFDDEFDEFDDLK